MRELFQASLPYLPAALAPLLLLLLAPLYGKRTRVVFGVLLLVGSLGFVVDVLTSDHSDVHTLTVKNVFPRANEPEPHVWNVAVEKAPLWQYHILIALALGLPALLLLALRNRKPHAPQPALYGATLGILWLALRLGLEKTAAREPLVFAIGLDFALLLILPFFGWYSGRLGFSFRKLVGQLLLMACLQRLALIAFGYWATVNHKGTHLDTHLVTDIRFAPFKEVVFKDATQAWIWTTLIPHATLWIVFTLVAGIVLGTIPFLIARRRN